MNSAFFKIFFVILTVSLFACKTKQISNQTETIRFDEPSEVTIIEEIPTSEDVVVLDTAFIDVAPIDTLEEVFKKDKYKVAVVLPFMEDSVRKLWNATKDKNFQELRFTKESDLAISFTEGMVTALKELKLDSKFEIIYYDDNNDDSNIAYILNEIKSEEVDFIIGGVNRQNLVKLSSLAKSQDIMLLSPFSPSKSAAAGNSKYYMFEPSLEQHIKAMINYSLDSIEDPHFKFIYHDNPASQSYAIFISEYLNDLNENRSLEEKVKYALIETPIDDFEVGDALDDGANNVFIVNSFDETFIHTFLKQINGSNKNNSIVAFGMPGWENSKILRLDYLNNSNIHFTKSSWIDWEREEVESFSDKYHDKYATKPSESAFLGYDFTKFIFNTISEQGLNINKALIGKPYFGLDRNFLFEKMTDDDTDVNRIENAYLRIYKIENFEAILVR